MDLMWNNFSLWNFVLNHHTPGVTSKIYWWKCQLTTKAVPLKDIVLLTKNDVKLSFMMRGFCRYLENTDWVDHSLGTEICPWTKYVFSCSSCLNVLFNVPCCLLSVVYVCVKEDMMKSPLKNCMWGYIWI